MAAGNRPAGSYNANSGAGGYSGYNPRAAHNNNTRGGGGRGGDDGREPPLSAAPLSAAEREAAAARAAAQRALETAPALPVSTLPKTKAERDYERAQEEKVRIYCNAIAISFRITFLFTCTLTLSMLYLSFVTMVAHLTFLLSLLRSVFFFIPPFLCYLDSDRDCVL